MVEQLWWNSYGGTVMVKELWWKSHGGRVMVEQSWWNSDLLILVVILIAPVLI